MEANHSLTGADLKEWREVQRLSQEELGKLLGLSREWIGKLERGERTVSAEIFLTFERVRRELRFSLKENSPDPSSLDGPLVNEDPGGQINDSPAIIRHELRTLLDEGIGLAGNDVARLGWLLYQAKQHLQPPAAWSKLSTQDKQWVKAKMDTLKQKVAERELAAPAAESEHAS